jgi:hypothetical protein
MEAGARSDQRNGQDRQVDQGPSDQNNKWQRYSKPVARNCERCGCKHGSLCWGVRDDPDCPREDQCWTCKWRQKPAREVFLLTMHSQAQNPLVDLRLRTTTEIAAELEELYLHTGDPCCERAARTLRQGTNPGRPPIDDNLALQGVEWLMENGKFATLNRAFLQVAAAHEPDKNPRSPPQPAAAVPGSLKMSRRPTPHYPSQAPRTSGTACCSGSAPSTDVPT